MNTLQKPEISSGFFLIGKKNGLQGDNLSDLLAESFTYSIQKNTFDANTFLHGVCDIFAYALAKLFNYTIYQVVDDNGYIVHAFCIYRKNNTNLYIDARGITSDYDDFISDFEDFFEDENLKYKFQPFNYKNFEEYSTEDFNEFYLQAINFISKYKEYYNTKTLCQ